MGRTHAIPPDWAEEPWNATGGQCPSRRAHYSEREAHSRVRGKSAAASHQAADQAGRLAWERTAFHSRWGGWVVGGGSGVSGGASFADVLRRGAQLPMPGQKGPEHIGRDKWLLNQNAGGVTIAIPRSKAPTSELREESGHVLAKEGLALRRRH